MAYHDRGFEIIGICVDDKTEEMDAILKQIPWPIVFEKPDDTNENSVLKTLGISMAPVKILVNPDGILKKSNLQPVALLQMLEEAYGPIQPQETEAAEGAEGTESTESGEPAVDTAAEATEALETTEETTEALETETTEELNFRDDDADERRR